MSRVDFLSYPFIREVYINLFYASELKPEQLSIPLKKITLPGGSQGTRSGVPSKTDFFFFGGITNNNNGSKKSLEDNQTKLTDLHHE